jgi:hypothetical protein
MDGLKEHIICSFPYGSMTYGIKPTEHSDIDIVAIVDDSMDFSMYCNEIYEEKTKTNINGRDIEIDAQYIRESKFIEMVKMQNILN